MQSTEKTSTSTESLHPLEVSHLQARRERVFLVMAGLFLGSLTMLNILGISRFLVLFSIDATETGRAVSWGQWASTAQGWSFALAIGVLPYPVTFLCTDLISEFYGRRRANWVVTVGFLLNVWVVFILYIGGIMPQIPVMDPQTGLPPIDSVSVIDGNISDPNSFAFYQIRALTFGAVTASMIAYLAAQFCDVYLFHFWKRLTKGKHLWLRNNGSTIVSQAIDTVAVILITHFYAHALPIPADLPANELIQKLLMFIITGYVFKLVIALFDTIPFYLITAILKRYLEFDPMTEHAE
ncbi:MAG: queuosine precursor transporter [Mariniblastus sp.]|nr:queuosine precursor transporter [Mariniblastus sp.]